MELVVNKLRCDKSTTFEDCTAYTKLFQLEMNTQQTYNIHSVIYEKISDK